MKHPLLRNPAKWLVGVEKGYSAQLYLSKFYNPQILAANPFALALTSTRKDVSNARFPLGNMTQIVVQKKGPSDYQLVPVLEKPTQGQNPASYVLANADYIEFVSKRHFKPVPLKYRHRSPAIANSITVVEDFVGEVDRMLLERIQAFLGKLEENDVLDPGIVLQLGIHLEPSPSTRGWWDNGVYCISGPFCRKRITVPYIGHEQLCSVLTKYVRFKNIKST